MAANRILYFFAAVAAAAFYFASSLWVSWMLLVLVAALPWISLIFSLPAILTTRVAASLPTTAEENEAVNLHIHLRLPRFLPTPEVRMRLNLRTRDTMTDLRFLSRLSRADGVLSVPTSPCGYLAPELRKGRVYDYLGLWAFPVKAPSMPVMAILPAAAAPEPMPNMEQILNQQLRPKNGGGYSEIHDHRPYRPGDPVKGIHWKLSLKADELIIREPMESVRRSIILAIRTPRGPVSRTKTLGSFRYLSSWLVEHGVDHTVLWMDGEDVVRAEIHDADDMLAALTSACLVPETSSPLPERLPLKADWLCRIGEQEAVK